MAIRYDKKLNQEINRTIRNFNQKIARLEKQEKELLPTKISKKELKNSVYNRNELKRKLKELQRFSQRGAEEIMTTKTGVRMTKYEYNELKRESARVKRMVTRNITNMKINAPTIFGKKQIATFAQMGDKDYLNMLSRRKALEKNILKLNKEELERYKKLVLKTGKNQQYMNNVFKENYAKMITDLGYFVGYDSDKLDLLKQKFMTLEPNKFLKLFKNEKSISAIMDYYPMATHSIIGISPDDIREDVTGLYDTLIDNIDEIMKDYV